METNYKFKEPKDFKKAHPNLYKLLSNRGELEKLCLDMNWKYDLKNHASEQQHKEFIIKNKINTEHKYLKICKTSELKLLRHPYRRFGYKTFKMYLNSIFGIQDNSDEHIPFASEQEHKEFIIEEGCDSISKYQKVYKTSKLRLNSNPHRFFGYSNANEYFNSIFPYKNNRTLLYASEDEHRGFIIETNSTCAAKYSKIYKTSELKLHSQPWVLFGYANQTDYFKSIFGDKKNFASEDEHRNFIIKTNSTGNHRYNKVYKTSELRLHSHPDKLFGYASEQEYFESIFGKNRIKYKDKIKKQCFKESEKSKNYIEFKKRFKSSYYYAIKYGWLEEIKKLNNW